MENFVLFEHTVKYGIMERVKRSIVTIHILLAAILLLLTTCKRDERDNPWDRFATIAPSEWAPSSLQIEDKSITSKTIIWEYNGDDRIEGFAIDRKVGNANWQVSHHTTEKDIRSWTDENVTPDTTISYTYCVYAIAGENISSEISNSSKPIFPAPTNLSVSASSSTSVTLVWQYNQSGHQGFKLDRKAGDNDWQESFVTIDKTQTTYTDNSVEFNSSDQYLYRVYAYYEQYNSEKIEVYIGKPELSTASITNITATSATSGGNITSDGGAAVTTRGVVWSTIEYPTIETNEGSTSNGTGTGSWVSELVELQPGTVYYIRAYATNSVGTQYGNRISVTTVADVTNPTTGKTWLDRNLGASRVAQSSTDTEAYGDLYQWGRGTDGHQIRTSGTTSTLSSSDKPGHGNFITVGSSSPYDWRSPQNNNLWQGVNGVNNPCPAGYRLPTEAELNAERVSWGSNDAAGAFASPLKLPLAGIRFYSTGSLYVGSSGNYWSSTLDGTSSRRLYFHSNGALVSSEGRANGDTVRCIKD